MHLVNYFLFHLVLRDYLILLQKLYPQHLHLRRHHRLSLGLLADALDRDDALPRELATGENTSDIMNKCLETVKRHRHRIEMGVE